MNPISAERSRERDLHPSDVAPDGAGRADAGTPSPRREADVEHAYSRVSDAPEWAAFVRELEAAAAKAAVARGRLDAFRASFSGPYVVDGRRVEAPPMFRMNGGFNDGNGALHAGELAAICERAHVSGAIACRNGRPTPEQLVQVTQALIDAGKLPPNPPGAVALRIRQMQWRYGIGVDCAGYAEQAARAARGERPAPPSTGDAFSGMRSDPHFEKIAIGDIRTGDVIHLDPAPGERVGHNVVVYDHELVDDATRRRLTSVDPAAATFLSGPGPFHAIEVDSSWGADDGNDYGGFRRDTWVYDEGTKRWGSFDPADGTLRVSELGPASDRWVGAFRRKESR